MEQLKLFEESPGISELTPTEASAQLSKLEALYGKKRLGEICLQGVTDSTEDVTLAFIRETVEGLNQIISQEEITPIQPVVTEVGALAVAAGN